jgi:hypothetical protein
LGTGSVGREKVIVAIEEVFWCGCGVEAMATDGTEVAVDIAFIGDNATAVIGPMLDTCLLVVTDAGVTNVICGCCEADTTDTPVLGPAPTTVFEDAGGESGLASTWLCVI